MCFDWFYRRLYKIDPPKETEDIGWFDCYSLLQAEFPNAKLYLSDNEYKTAPLGEYKRFLSASQVDKHKYVSEYFDCDDFSYALMGEFSIPKWSALAFGIVWTETTTGNHALNFFIDNNLDVWLIEPQTDSIFPMPKDWKAYLIMM
jgi:hypothetical protein